MDVPAFVHHAVPVHPDERERLFKETLSFHAAEKVLQRRFNRAGWIVGSIGALLGLAAVAAILTTVCWLPQVLKTTRTREAGGSA